MKRINSGFTLIELMIVVVIIGILVAVGIPQYQNYVARSQAAEGFSLAGGLKTALAEYHDTHGVFPDSTTDAHTAIGIEPAGNIIGKYITGVVVSDDGSGTITATFGPASQHDGKFLRLTPTSTDGAVYFDCTTDIEESYRPSGCEEFVGSDSDVPLFTGDTDDILLPPVPEPDTDSSPVLWADRKDGDNACWDGSNWIVGNLSPSIEGVAGIHTQLNGYADLGWSATIDPNWECYP